jgi:SAM-dependent MidA family methyltransferase
MNRRFPILPKPDPDAQSHSDLLLNKILKEISHKGPLPFSRYMEMALYEPGLGYYCAGNIKFGEKGDFITAPEISPLFSQCIARPCKQILTALSNERGILELGAGSGKMACDLLMALEENSCLPDFYWILDLSPELKARQKVLFETKIPHLMSKIKWLSTLPKLPFQGVILANEVLDAMPIHRFKQEKILKEYYVAAHGQELTWELSEPSDPHLIEQIKILHLPEGYSSEINLLVKPWLNALNQSLKKGVLLVIDYGYLEPEYYHSQRTQGTLTCYYRHHAHNNPLILPGIQDITAHVNFTALQKAAAQQGFRVAGYSNQTNFLIRCGLTDFISPLLNQIEQFKIQQQIKQLILPTEMGELFKVMALTKNLEISMIGFK